MEKESKLPKIAAGIAFVMAALGVVNAIGMGGWYFLPVALIPLASGIQLLRKRVWGAYGFAFYMAAELMLIPLLWLRGSAGSAQVWASAFFAALLLVIFVLAGRALEASGAQKGSPAPWIAVALLLTLPLLLVGAFIIPTGAMEDTLLVGDKILVQVFPKPHFADGEVVVFRYPIDHKQTFVKRIIGSQGDRLKISNRIVIRNGLSISEPYAVHKRGYVDPYADFFPSNDSPPFLYPSLISMLDKNVINGELVVPPHKYFVLGDNRDNSLDSRYWGFVGEDEIIGKPLMIYDSQDVPSGPSPNPFASHTRWNRIFKLIR